MRKLVVALSVLVCSVEARAISFTISSSSAEAGGVAEFVVSIFGIQSGGVPANNAQLDILFDTSVFYVPEDARLACQVSPHLAHLVHTESLPRSPAAPAGMQRLRLNVIDTIAPLGDITDGDFYLCALDVREDARSGNTTLAGTRQNVGDTAGRVLGSSVGSGVVVISGSGSVNALQPRGGAGGVPVPPAALEIPDQAPVTGGGRPAQPVESGKTGRIGSVAEQRATPAIEGVAPAQAGATRGVELGQREAVGDKPAASTPKVGDETPTPGATPSPEMTKPVTPQATKTKVVTSAAAKEAKAVKEVETPAKKEGWGGCAMGRQESSWEAGLAMVAGLAVWLLRRKTA